MNLGVDIGGTFTDLVAYDHARGELVVGKSLNLGAGPRQDVEGALGESGLEAPQVRRLTHGTTAVTNLLIERAGATVGLLTTRGFRDVLEIQLSYRARSLDLAYVKTPPAVPRHLRLEISGRIDASGHELEPIDPDEVRAAVDTLLEHGVEAIAIALFNAYANPEHERRVAAIAEDVAGVPVTASTDVDRRAGEYERTSTAVLNASAVPRMHAYVDDLEGAVSVPIRYMHSAAGVLPASEARLRPIQLALSGPAAGVLAARDVAQRLGIGNVITMDMGGTSCDVSLVWDGALRFRSGIDIDWGVPARIDALDVHTIGAGGGSLCSLDAGGALTVGPRSAGAVPGPACYGRGGLEPTVTDANLALGVISPAGLLGGRLELDREAALRSLEGLGAKLDLSTTETARGIHAIVSANMAQAIREITVQRGIDPRECALVAFGGAGAQHAAAVADHLEIRRVVVPMHGSVLSAMGLLTAPARITSTRTLLEPLEVVESAAVVETLEQLASEAGARLGGEPDADTTVEHHIGLRYVGQWHEIAVPFEPDVERVTRTFEDLHEQLYGTRLGTAIEIVGCSATLTRRHSVGEDVWSVRDGAGAPPPGARRRLELFDADVEVLGRRDLDRAAHGPCLVEEAQSVTVVPPRATVSTDSGHIVMEIGR